MILDSLGELHMLRGDLDQAKDYLIQRGRACHRKRKQVVCGAGAAHTRALLSGDEDRRMHLPKPARR